VAWLAVLAAVAVVAMSTTTYDRSPALGWWAMAAAAGFATSGST
jgi:hypothetical protein